jgi:hypothetical protein
VRPAPRAPGSRRSAGATLAEIRILHRREESLETAQLLANGPLGVSSLLANPARHVLEEHPVPKDHHLHLRPQDRPGQLRIANLALDLLELGHGVLDSGAQALDLRVHLLGFDGELGDDQALALHDVRPSHGDTG